jgi:hypothetical protein
LASKVLFLYIYNPVYLPLLPITGPVVRFGEKRNACRVLVGKPEEKRPLGKPGIKWEDNIKMDL